MGARGWAETVRPPTLHAYRDDARTADRQCALPGTPRGGQRVGGLPAMVRAPVMIMRSICDSCSINSASLSCG